MTIFVTVTNFKDEKTGKEINFTDERDCLVSDISD